MKLTIGFDQEIAIFLHQPANVVHLRRRESIIESEGNRSQPKLHFEVFARNVNMGWFVRFAAVEMKSVWADPHDGGHSHLRQANQGINPRLHRTLKSGRAPSFPKAPFISMAISRILSPPETVRGRDDHLSQLTCVNRPIPPKRDRDATIPEDQRGGALPLFCLAPHGVFRASRITPRAVSSYLAFSTLPELRCQRTGGVFSVTLSVNPGLGRGRPRVLRGMLPYGVRTFLSGLLQSDHLPSRGSYHILR